MNTDYFQWGPEFETGMETLDRQHQGLVCSINDLLQLCIANKAIHESAVRAVYGTLSEYILEHFSTEEALMRQYNIDDRHKAAHMLAHEAFKRDVRCHFSEMSLMVQPRELAAVTEFLIRWLAYHILSIDQSLVRQIEAIQNDKLSPASAYDKEANQCITTSEPLLKALRSLFDVISEKNKELQQQNDALEETVTQRTLDLQRALEKLEYISMRDELTGLYNRRYALECIELCLGEWRRYQSVFSVLFIDADKFKSVNDHFGHDAGDKVLKWLAAFLQRMTRKTDIVCRLGGDEFLIICKHCDAGVATQLALKLDVESKKPFEHEILGYWDPSLSIGVAEVHENCQSTSELLKSADEAMYLVKQRSGGSSISPLEKPFGL